MIEFNTNIFWLITCSVLAALLVTLIFYLRYIVKKYKEVAKEYLESLDKQDEYCDKILELQDMYINISKEHIAMTECVSGFIEGHNEWHDRKIRFYYDQNGWHCCYDDEMPQGDTFTEQEEITPQNENKDENQQSI